MTETQALLQSIRVLIQVFLVNERAFPSAEGQMGYSPHVFQAVNFIAERKAVRASELGAVLGLVPTTTSSLIGRLVAKGLVVKNTHPDDRRAVALELSPEGRALYEAIHRQDLRNMELMLSALDPSDRATFVDLIGQVAAHVRKAATQEAAPD